MGSLRRIALITGLFFLATEFTAIGAVLLYHGVLHDSRFILSGSAGDNGVLLGALLEVLLAVAVIGTAVTVFPIVKRQNEGLALGYVAGRLLEASLILVGTISLLAIVTLRQGAAGATDANAAWLVTIGKSLVAIHDWTFLFGPNFVLGLNSLVLAYLMYRSGLVPRLIAVLGLIGGPVIFASAIAVMFGLYAQTSTLGLIAGLPVLAWEVSLAVWLITKGFKPSPIIADYNRPVAVDNGSLAPVPVAR